MAVEKVINIKVQESGIDEVNKDLNSLDKNLQKVDKESSKTSKGLKDVGDNGGAIAILDELTGGLATRVKDAYEATKLFNFGLKGTRTALIATGIGAFVVALGLVVAYWDDIVNYISGANENLESQHKLLETNLSLLDSELSLLEKQIKFNDERNISNKENLKKQKQLLIEKKKLIAEDIKILEAQLLKEQSVSSELSLWQKFQLALGNIPDLTLIDEEEQKRINDLRAQILKLKEEGITVDSILNPSDKNLTEASTREKVTVLDLITPEEEQTTLNKVETLFDKIFDVQQMANDALKSNSKEWRENLQNDVEYDANLRKAQQENLEKALKESRERDLIESKILNAQKIELTKQGLNAISNVVGKTSAAGKAVAIATSLINTYQGISAELATKTATPFEFGLKLANIASVTAIGFKAVKDIVSTKLPSFAGSAGSAGGGGASAPAFNVVGTSGVNQLAESLQQDQQPVQAYVVGSNVTTQQELDRNIVDTVSLG